MKLQILNLNYPTMNFSLIVALDALYSNLTIILIFFSLTNGPIMKFP